MFTSLIWGVDFQRNGINPPYHPGPAIDYEIQGNLRLLNIGMGKTKTFKYMGWSFRKAPYL